MIDSGSSCVLPLENLLAQCDRLIDVVGCAAFQLANEVTDQQPWRDCYGDVNVRFGPPISWTNAPGVSTILFFSKR
jgi:hypothetical protein